MEVRIGIVSGSRIAVNRDGTEPGRIVDAVVTDVRDVQSAEMCQAGEEYNPPEGVRVILVSAGDACKMIVAADDGIAPVMAKGGRRLYATEQTGETVMAELRLHPDGRVDLFNDNVAVALLADGTARVENDNGSFTMSPAGVFTFHGTGSHFDHPVTMAQGLAVAGNVSASGTVADASGTMDEMRGVYNEHGHTGSGGVNPPAAQMT